MLKNQIITLSFLGILEYLLHASGATIYEVRPIRLRYPNIVVERQYRRRTYVYFIVITW